MSVMRTLFLASLAAMIQAFTPPTAGTWGSLLTPDLTHPVTQGQTFTVTWDPTGHTTDGVTVSLVLCKGPSNNCVTQSTAIVEGIPAAQKSYSWAVPCSLAPGVQATETGYGMLVIVDGTGEFQYSTQFSVLAGPSCGAVSSSSSSVVSSSAPVVSSSDASKPTSSASISKSSASASNTSYTGGNWSSSSAAALSSVSSVSSRNATSTLVTSTASATSYTVTTRAPVPTSAITSAATSASTTRSMSTFTGAAPQATTLPIGALAAAALAMLAL